MDIKSLVEYQKVDAKLYQLEREINFSKNKQKCLELSKVAKESQQKSTLLESQAGKIAKEIQDLFKVADQNKLKLKELLSQKVEEMTPEQIDSSIVLKDKLMQNLAIIDKKATKLAELANQTLAEFNRTKINYKNAGEKYAECKKAYDEEVKEITPKMKELREELAALEKSVDVKLFNEYKKRRADKIFPVVVQLIGRSCGGCHMEVPASSIAKLDSDQILVCENCRRILYK